MKKQYEELGIILVMLGEEDILRTSGDETIPPVDDENQGEWA